MRGTFSIKAIDKMQATLTLSAEVGEFRELAAMIRALDSDPSWPICDTLRQIDDLIMAAEKAFYSESAPKSGAA